MELYADYGIEIPEGAEGEVRAICPKCTPDRKSHHQGEKDLAVNVDSQTWFCHHCGWADGLKNIESYQPKYERPTYEPNNLPQGMIDYFAKRGISKSTLDKANIGYLQPQGKQGGAIQFPRYKQSEVVAIKYRTHDKRMWQSKNPEPCFFNYDNALQSGQDTLIITEGEIDALSWMEAGFHNVASVPDGAPAVTAKNLDKKFAFLEDGLAENFRTFVLSVDNDEPGQNLERQLADRIGRHKCLRVNYPTHYKDINDILIDFGGGKLHEIYKNAKSYPIDGLYTTEDVWDAVMDLYRVGLRPGESTGWATMDKHYTVRPCEMTVITGIPGSGKSTWLDALATNLYLQHEWKIAFCSPENWPVQRHIASIAEKLIEKPFAAPTPTAPRMTQEELERAMQEINGAFFFTQLRDSDMHIDGVLDVMQAAISRHGVKGVVLDPWNELEYHRPPQLSETEFVSEALGKIRQFARMNDVHVWIVAHPTKLRKNEDGTYPVPRLYDVSGSAHFYNKPDNGIAVYRKDPKGNDVEVYVQKIRFREVGQIGRVDMRFIKDSGTFLEVENQA